MATQDPWNREWTIVRSDDHIAHVMLPMSTFRLTPHPDNPARYQVDYQYQAPFPDPFSETQLIPIGDKMPRFCEAGNCGNQIARYQRGTPVADEYAKISDAMASYFEENREFARLEGTIKIQCHRYGADPTQVPPPPGRPPHMPLTLSARVHFYRFESVVMDTEAPLLLIHIPLAPLCPWNGDGTAIGLGKN